MIAITPLVKYQSGLDSKISSLFATCYPFHKSERLESSTLVVHPSVLPSLVLARYATKEIWAQINQLIRKSNQQVQKQTKQSLK